MAIVPPFLRGKDYYISKKRKNQLKLRLYLTNYARFILRRAMR